MGGEIVGGRAHRGGHQDAIADQFGNAGLAIHQDADLGGLAGFAQLGTAELAYGRKRALELATTLATDPELMLLDEPTQGMGHEDVHRVTELIKKVSVGRTILMVEHNMNVVSGICDKISVLQRGAMLAEGRYEEVSNNPLVMEAYMGTTTGELEGVH